MLTVQEALDRVLADVPRQSSEEVPLAEAHGRILAADVRSPRDVPPWDNSAMDGYAVRAADTAGGDVSLRLLEVIAAGMAPSRRLEPGTASGIMTGAPVPEGADAVVMVEKTDASREGEVRIFDQARPGQNIRRRGGDVRAEEVVLHAGERLTPARVGLAASLGLPELTVSRRPIVAILSTGDEVVEPGRPLGPGQIYSSNNYTLAGLVRETGCIPHDAGNAEDTLDAILEALVSCAEQADVVVTTGGVSVGLYDYVKDAYAEMGAELDFWKVKMKPGKPLAFGHVRRGNRTVPLFGLPGNPVSCVVNYLQFVRPFLLTSMGAARPFLPVVDAIAEHDIGEKAGRAKLIRVELSRSGGQLLFRSAGSQSSGVLATMARAHGLLALPVESSGIRAGETGRVQLLDPSFLDGEEPGYGW